MLAIVGATGALDGADLAVLGAAPVLLMGLDRDGQGVARASSVNGARYDLRVNRPQCRRRISILRVNRLRRVAELNQLIIFQLVRATRTDVRVRALSVLGERVPLLAQAADNLLPRSSQCWK